MKNFPNNDRKTLRGGSWFSYQDYARAVFRGFNHPSGRNDLIGFRLLEELSSFRGAGDNEK